MKNKLRQGRKKGKISDFLEKTRGLRTFSLKCTMGQSNKVELYEEL